MLAGPGAAPVKRPFLTWSLVTAAIGLRLTPDPASQTPV